MIVCADKLWELLGATTEEQTSRAGGGERASRGRCLVLDDLGLGDLTAPKRHDLLEVMEDRYGRASTIITSQLPLNKWQEWIGDPTIADAILDRLVHNAYKINLKGTSRRKNNNDLS